LTVGTMLAGSKVRLEVRRAGQTQSEKIDVTLAKFYVPGKRIASVRPVSFRGLRVDYTSLLVQQHPLGEAARIHNGVLVCEVQPQSAAATALLEPGRIITHVNGRPVQTPSSFYQTVNGLNGPVELTLLNSNPGQAPLKVTIN
jgi:S1-C subfamily serine protease